MQPCPSITPVVLCGGSGMRLWPLSRKSLPKQFVPLLGGKSLLQTTFERVRSISDQVFCVTSDQHRHLASEIMAKANVSGSLLLEPIGRNTAAAMCSAAILIEEQKGDEILLFCPADHHIPDNQAFRDAIERGLVSAQGGHIVTLGIFPTYPSSAYGYIVKGKEQEDGAYHVDRFIEKPSVQRATELLLEQETFWNSGIFLVSAKTLISAITENAPDILAACQNALRDKKVEQSSFAGVSHIHPDPKLFALIRSESIDFAVMEHHKKVSMIPYPAQWSDVGSWNAIAELVSPDKNGNRTVGAGYPIKSKSTFIYSENRTTVALGTENLIIIDTDDALLVADSSCAEEVKTVVNMLEKEKLPQATMHRKVFRPWGWYDSIDYGDRFQVKRICVKPGAALSLQKHAHRAEHWVVVRGVAEVTRGTDTFLLQENQSTYIPIGEIHRLRNLGEADLEMIEVQSGDYLGEDDIVRIQDNYGRV